jgi:hypothetical protein
MKRPVSTILRDLAGAVSRGTRHRPWTGDWNAVSPSPAMPLDIGVLIYELLDAHADTAELVAEHDWHHDPRWSVHLDYLRILQRAGREALAHSDTRQVQ